MALFNSLDQKVGKFGVRIVLQDEVFKSAYEVQVEGTVRGMEVLEVAFETLLDKLAEEGKKRLEESEGAAYYLLSLEDDGGLKVSKYYKEDDLFLLVVEISILSASYDE